jgi:hypothetical protein
MGKLVERQCPACQEVKTFRDDVKTCGCAGTNPFKKETPELTENSEIQDSGWSISLPKTRIHTLEQLIAYFEIDLTIWEVERFVANKWEVAAKNEAEKLVVEPLYQVKAFLRKRREIVDARVEIAALKEQALKEITVKPPFVQKPAKTTGNMLEIDLFDPHFGKMAWAEETGHQNFDVKICTKLYKKAFYTLLERASHYSYDEIWYVVGNDMFHTDNAQGTTTSGTIVSTDARYHKTFGVVRNTVIECIEELRKRCKKVKVIVVSGNHDELTSWHLGDSLTCWFREYNDVVIDNQPTHYKYHQFGKVMVLYTHGDKGKRKEYPLLMATERPEMFGATKFREAHTGHRHTDKVEEYHGVKVRILSALCPPDRWHAEHAFVGNLRRGEAFIWNKEEGLIGTASYTDTRDKIED